MKRINKGRAVITLLAIALVVVSQAQTVAIADPTQGQSLQQQQKDDAACQAWAKNTIGTDPAAVVSDGVAPLRRAQFACMERLGYTIRQKRAAIKPIGYFSFEVFFLLSSAALAGYFDGSKGCTWRMS
jgi:hypothetical protein